MSQTQAVYHGGCYCGATRFEVSGKPIISAYCHCTLCQRLTGCPFVHTIHFDPPAFRWTHDGGEQALELYKVKDKPAKHRYRCKECGACVASYHAQRDRWSIWGGQLKRTHETGQIEGWREMKATHHIFYGTRMLDVEDGLAKWEGYENTSTRLG
ncbi:hypothetical protein E1B28_001695 [Marasmius oreades]|uniref:CENP-V/GFA domain-containing protein n=1 Tax=Marasmius oreades TaxID=181124 RepID=A0A9P7V3Y1_9AGAR|nr:uncharacterized protein E1B28_001695 [Marasmius oreades]KAG7099894.1 hypothetical protein E1B28_001695 [Marasmius oreades]